MSYLLCLATEVSKEEDEYQRQFFLLKVFVLGGVGSVLTILAALFWAYFMYLWKTLDSSLKRDHVIGGGPGGGVDHAAMAVQEAANQAAYEKAALELAELGRTHLTTEMLADDMIQVIKLIMLKLQRQFNFYMESTKVLKDMDI